MKILLTIALLLCGCVSTDPHVGERSAAQSPTAQPTYSIQAPNNQGILTQGQSGGTNTIVRPIHQPYHFYSNDVDLGFGEGATDLGSQIKFAVFHAMEGFPWGQEVDYNGRKIICVSPFTNHTYGMVSGGGPTWYKIWDLACQAK
jgi:hypothetical protein